MSTTTSRPTTLRNSFSFYLPARDPALIKEAAVLADAVVLKGPAGPPLALQMRRAGFSSPILFDYAGYEAKSKPITPVDWMAQQAAVGADRLLTPGRWVPWDPTGDAIRNAVAEERKTATTEGATVVLAVDSRWLTNGLYKALDAFRKLQEPLALVLGNSRDPLSARDAVNGLLALNQNHKDLTILRSDHGAVGAVAFGAVHASIGLSTTYRHFVPPTSTGGGIPNDRSARVFVPGLMDWFTAFNIAGWAVSKKYVRCDLTCCEGQGLDRFLNADLAIEARRHNMLSLAGLADYVVNAPATDRRRIFALRCADALDRYGYMGKLSMVIEPKSQLLQWAQFA